MAYIFTYRVKDALADAWLNLEGWDLDDPKHYALVKKEFDIISFGIMLTQGNFTNTYRDKKLCVAIKRFNRALRQDDIDIAKTRSKSLLAIIDAYDTKP
jgi:hypothetical protein